MGQISRSFNEGTPHDKDCPSRSSAGDDDLGEPPKRRNERRRKFTLAQRVEIGERDRWLCGICHDPVHLVERPPVMLVGEISVEDLDAAVIPPGDDWSEAIERLPPRPLSASIDHIMPLAAGGTDEPGNLQIAHLYCNLHKNASRPGSGWTRPEYVRAVLASLIGHTSVPEAIHRGCHSSWAYPASRRVEFMIALAIAAGEVEADPRYGDPDSRSDAFICELGHDRWLELVADMKRRRANWRARWQPVD
jgi:hypothetical protein